MNWLSTPTVCPGLFYGTPCQDGYLMRIRTPGGILTDQQGEAIASLAEEWNGETIQVTNRANLQLRSIQPLLPPSALVSLQKLGLAAHNPQVDHLRNIMASPTAGIDPQELIDTRPLVDAVHTYIQSSPQLAQLPPKLSIGIDGGGRVGIGTASEIPWEHRYNEIQLSAVLVKQGINSAQPNPSLENVYLHLSLGGDHQLWDTQVLIHPQECIPVITALLKVYGDYLHQFPHSQKKPRMKHLLQDWGLQDYLQRVNDSLSFPLPIGCHTPTSLGISPYAYLGVHPQLQAGLSYIGIHLSLGQLTVKHLRGLVELCRNFGNGELRLTPWQTIVLPHIPNSQVPEVVEYISSLGLFVPNHQDGFKAQVVACWGKPGCTAAATQTQSHGLTLAACLHQRLKLELPVNIHLTGCTKTCAQPSPAEIMLLGTEVEHLGKTVEGYHILINSHLPDTVEITRMEGYLGLIPAFELPNQIASLLTTYQRHRTTAEETFGAFALRFGKWKDGG